MTQKILNYYKQLARLGELPVRLEYENEPVDAEALPTFLELIRAAWDSPVTPAVIERAASEFRAEGRCTSCGGSGVVPDRVGHYIRWLDLSRYGTLTARSPTWCPACTDGSKSNTGRLAPPEGPPCEACGGSALLPDWAAEAIMTGRSEWLTKAPYEGKHWYPTYCRACGGWGTTCSRQSSPSPPSSWTDQHSPPQATSSSPVDQRSWRREGNVRAVVFQGRSFHDKDRIGYRYIGTLLARPRTPIDCADLARRPPAGGGVDAEAEGLAVVSSIRSAGEDRIDRKTLRKYKRALEAVVEEIETAGPDQREELERQRKFLEKEIQKDERTEKQLGSGDRRPITAVSKAISEAISSAKKRDKMLGEFLEKHVRRRHNAWVYEPGTDRLPWDVTEG